MGQIVGRSAKTKRCNLSKLSQLEIPAAGEYILVSSDNSMNAAGQGNFDSYIVGDGTKAATALPLRSIVDNVQKVTMSVTGTGTTTFVTPTNYYTLKYGKDVIVKIDFGGTVTDNRSVLRFEYNNGTTWLRLYSWDYRGLDIPSMPSYIFITLPSNALHFRFLGNTSAGDTISADIWEPIAGIEPNYAIAWLNGSEVESTTEQSKNESLGRYSGVFALNKKVSIWNGGITYTNATPQYIIMTSDDVKEGTIVYYSITVSNPSDPCNFYLETLDANNTRIAIYGKTSASASSTTNYKGSFVVPSNFSKLLMRGSAYGVIDYIFTDYAPNGLLTKLHSVDVAKEVGYLSKNVSYDAGISSSYYVIIPVLFTSSDVSVGDTIQYSFDLKTGTNKNGYIELLNSNNTRIAIYGKSSMSGSTTHFEGSFVIPEGFATARYCGSDAGVINYIRTKYANINLFNKITTDDASLQGQITSLQNAISSISGVNNAKYITGAVLNTAPITILANNDAGATIYDNGLVNFASILKVSESMYYLYYTCYGKTDTITDPNQHLAFAYSTDGFTYTRGFPNGITPPIAGTNLIAQNNMIELCVFKVQDATNPFRMVANKAVGDVTQIVTLYKSADGINWTEIKELTAGGNDTQTSVVVRGNVLKLFIRMYNNGRRVGVLYCDIDGNILSTPTIVIMDNNNLYMAAASALDDHREILFPTNYDPSTDEETMLEYILNGERYDQITLNTSVILSASDKSVYAAPSLINIGLDTYLLFATRSSSHNSFNVNTTISQLKLAKVTFVNNVNT